MSLFRSRTETRSTFSYQQFVDWYSAGTAGGTVDQALRNAASNACIMVLARTIARTPLDVVRYEGTRRRPAPTPRMISAPSGIVKATVWRRQLGMSLVTDGNAFGQIVSYDGGLPSQIELLDPCEVSGRRVENGMAQVTVSGRPEALWPHGNIWHVPGQTVLAGSPFGLSPLSLAARTIGTSLAVEDFSNRFFTDGGHPTTALMLDSDPGPEVARSIKDKFQAATQGRREPIVLPSSIKIEKLTSDPNTTGYIDLLRFEVEQACRFWLVPPAMVYAAVSGQNVTYANVTDADLNFLKHSIDDYFVSIDEALTDLLMPGLVVRANRDAILRADPKARNELHDLRLRNKTTTVNEVRALNDEEPFADPIYDEPGIPDALGDPVSRQVAEAVQKVYLGVDKVITADEARTIVNGLGANLVVPGPVGANNV